MNLRRAVFTSASTSPLSDRLHRQLGAERAEWENIQHERIQTERQQSQGKSRGMSW